MRTLCLLLAVTVLALMLPACEQESAPPTTPTMPKAPSEAAPKVMPEMAPTTAPEAPPAMDEHADHEHDAAAPDTGEAVKIVNTLCPVGNEPIDPKGPTVTYQGKTYAFCCPECVDEFKSDPAKYIQAMK